MIYTSPDAQWIAVRRGTDVRLLPGIEGAQTEDSTRGVPRTIALEDDTVELAFVGSPSALVAIARTRVTMYPLQTRFFRNALYGDDQLRQRVAFALHQIIVVSGADVTQLAKETMFNPALTPMVPSYDGL